MNLAQYHIYNAFCPANVQIPFGTTLAGMMMPLESADDNFVPTSIGFGDQAPVLASNSNSMLFAESADYSYPGLSIAMEAPYEPDLPIAFQEENPYRPTPATSAKRIMRYGNLHTLMSVGGGLFVYGIGALALSAILTNDISISQALQIAIPPAAMIAIYRVVRGISSNAHGTGISVYRGMDIGADPTFEMWSEKLNADVTLFKKGLLGIDDIEDTLKTGQKLTNEDGKTFVEALPEDFIGKIASVIKRDAFFAEALMLMERYGNEHVKRVVAGLKIKWSSTVLLKENIRRNTARSRARIAIKGAVWGGGIRTLVHEIKPSTHKPTSLAEITRWLIKHRNDGGLVWLERLARFHPLAREVYNEVIAGCKF